MINIIQSNAFHLFVSGLVAGFSVAAPIGPVSLLCVDHTLARGPLFGFVTALGASTADTLYGLVAAMGLTMVAAVTARYHHAIQVAGGILIILIGLYQFFQQRRAAAASPACSESVAKGFAVVFTSTLSNPFTVCFFISIFSAFAVGRGGGDQYRTAVAYAAGIFFGTASWWLLLSVIVGVFRKMIHEKGLLLIRKLSALAIMAIGAYALLR